MAAETAQKGESTVELETLKGDVQKLASDLREMLHSVGAQSKEKLVENKKRIEAAIKSFRGEAKEKFDEAYDCFREQSKEAVEKSRKQIEERPFTAVGIALGVGILLGALLRRR